MNTLAWITVVTHLSENTEDHLPQTSRLVGLVLQEAFESCTLVMRASQYLALGTKCMVELGQFEPATGTVSQVKELEPGVVRVAIEMTPDAEAM